MLEAKNWSKQIYELNGFNYSVNNFGNRFHCAIVPFCQFLQFPHAASDVTDKFKSKLLLEKISKKRKDKKHHTDLQD